MPLTGAVGAVTKILHDSLLAKLDPSFFRATCTIQAVTRTNVGGVVSEDWVDVAGLVALPCAIAPAGGGEQRRAQPYITVERETHTVVVAGYYTGVTAGHRALVATPGGESLTLNVLLVEHDSANTMTRLRCEAVSA